MKPKLTYVILYVLILVLLAFSVSCNIQQGIGTDIPSNDISTDIGEDITQEAEKKNAHTLNNDNTHSIEQCIDFSQMDFSSIDKVIIIDGTTGEKAELIPKDDIAVIIEEIKSIKGEEPISNKGYYGFTYTIELYHGDEKVYSFSLSPNDDDSISLICGYYETENGFDYPCRYMLTDCSYEYIDKILQEYLH